jgi:hypothetical protein
MVALKGKIIKDNIRGMTQRTENTRVSTWDISGQ